VDLSVDIISLASATLRISTPLVFAAMAGLFAERSGVIDFGLEGKMLAAAFVAASGAHVFGSEWYGLGLAIVCCVALSMLHGFASVTHKGDQVVSCVAINILMIGLTTALAAAWFGQQGLTPTLTDDRRFLKLHFLLLTQFQEFLFLDLSIQKLLAVIIYLSISLIF